MWAVRKLATLAQQKGLFRAASAGQVVMQFLHVILKGVHCDVQNNSIYTSLPRVCNVDVFVSHSWSCPSWMKLLAVCHHLNLDLAIGSSILACILAAGSLVLRAGSLGAVAKLPHMELYIFVMCCPMATFLLTYVFGHVFVSRRFWMDQVCVYQLDDWSKAETLKAIPGFIAESGEMLVLWDDTYFQRLWCNYELAVHAKATNSPEAMRLSPTWMPLWLLASYCTYFVVGYLCQGGVSPRLDADSSASLINSLWKNWSMPPYAYLAAALPLSWLCFKKLESHKLMLDQMEHFDLRSAKCTLETDRCLIEEQVLRLFDEASAPTWQVAFDASEGAGVPRLTDVGEMEASTMSLIAEDLQSSRHITSYPSNHEVIDEFNAYVRGPLRESVVGSLGKEEHISLKLCMVVNLPFVFMGLVILLGCDGHLDCDVSAANWGYPTVSQYFITNAVMDVFGVPLYSILAIALILRINCLAARAVSGHIAQRLLGSIFTTLVIAVVHLLMFLQFAMLIVVVIHPSPLWLAACVAEFILLLLALWLFFKKQKFTTPQCRQLIGCGI